MRYLKIYYFFTGSDGYRSSFLKNIRIFSLNNVKNMEKMIIASKIISGIKDLLIEM